MIQSRWKINWLKKILTVLKRFHKTLNSRKTRNKNTNLHFKTSSFHNFASGEVSDFILCNEDEQLCWKRAYHITLPSFTVSSLLKSLTGED